MLGRRIASLWEERLLRKVQVMTVARRPDEHLAAENPVSRNPATKNPADPETGPETAPETGPETETLWRNQDFLKFWSGEALSLFGTQVTNLALPLTAVMVFDASPQQVGLLR